MFWKMDLLRSSDEFSFFFWQNLDFKHSVDVEMSLENNQEIEELRYPKCLIDQNIKECIHSRRKIEYK